VILAFLGRNVNKRSRKWRFVIGILAISALVVATALVRFPPRPRPLCHRIIDGAFQQWALETGSTNSYPNTNGNGVASLAAVERLVGADIQQYGYDPGLHYDDPNDLVLMYMRKKTRHTWHGDTKHSIFSPSRWMVLSPEILNGTCPEGGELVDTPEFKRRLQLTVAFLKVRQRPYWEAVAGEQAQFLTSITN